MSLLVDRNDMCVRAHEPFPDLLCAAAVDDAKNRHNPLLTCDIKSVQPGVEGKYVRATADGKEGFLAHRHQIEYDEPIVAFTGYKSLMRRGINQ